MANHVLFLKNATVPVDPYREIFQTNGYTPTFIPLLNHGPYNRDLTIEFLTSEEFVEDIPILIITSQRAVEVFSQCLKDINDEFIKQKIFSKIAYTVGPATFKVLQSIGFKNVRGGELAGNGLKLSSLIIEEVSPQQRIVFFTGVIRKDIIPKQLLNANYNLIEKVIYKTENKADILDNFVTNWNIIQPHLATSIQWIIFFSPQGTESIINHIKQIELNKNIKIASIGPTTEQYLLENNIVPHVVADKPHADSLFQSILNFQSITNTQ